MIDFEQLRRWPDIEAPELVAHDATDRLLLDTADEALPAHPDAVTVIGDRYGALTLGVATLLPGARIRVHQDALSGELALDANAERLGVVPTWSHHGLDAALLEGARTVLLQLPRGLDALDEIAGLLARHAHPDVRVYAGGRVKHMTLTMNDVLSRHLGEVSAGRARQKSRILTATHPTRGGALGWPRTSRHGDVVVVAHGAAFAGTSIDVGTRALLAVLDRAAHAARDVVDLGCGTGVLAASFALARPGVRVVATDQSWAAVESAQATMRATGVADRVTVSRDDAGSSLPEASADVVLLNPPFHVGATVHTAISRKLFEAAARLLRPGGELWCVWNSPLGHRPVLERVVGATTQIARDPRFTVTRSIRRG
ncbi:class I SAM-dependent methyltransferase [Frigoribacterium sp. VKM Ac-2836]|uniref:class I SAM-dependent methyltransferase n=1 Tax=Frigoribacterium sp. VKM Ac-2836 TaxID=2739014 RepID=UPI001567C2A0|nr:class I SAM-dependent methyltransferase [Frigoribacterium sp. VKM Ac-2836]NRD27875.1 methyltransferase [Frigoribacterium sp. VKM Ac-2836]